VPSSQVPHMRIVGACEDGGILGAICCCYRHRLFFVAAYMETTRNELTKTKGAH